MVLSAYFLVKTNPPSHLRPNGLICLIKMAIYKVNIVEYDVLVKGSNPCVEEEVIIEGNGIVLTCFSPWGLPGTMSRKSTSKNEIDKAGLNGKVIFW
ncbi:MAG: hypothetical protein H6Q73_4466 [Firmicutes bacterium]|nr:hypothetical protein [Bacillota bacterium]